MDWPGMLGALWETAGGALELGVHKAGRAGREPRGTREATTSCVIVRV